MTQTTDERATLVQIQDYYGKKLNSSEDLRTGACCSSDAMPETVRRVLPLIDSEIKDRFYGCGSPIPLELSGRTVLDLGCGTGRDVYIVSKLVGPDGRVIGVDMTEEQLAVATRHVETQAKRFGYDKPNTTFHNGFIEDLRALDIEDESVDVVISNCVLNLSPDKPRVFSEIFRVLKPGGELYFSDVFADRRIPESLVNDPVLRGECLSGAMYIDDFRRLLATLGCPDHRVTAASAVPIHDPAIQAKIGMIDFVSLTIRAFKLAKMEDACEDYGQIATYLGTIEESPHTFVLDDHHTFHVGRPVLVCGNTAAMLEESRFAKHFTISGDGSTHFGRFESGSTSGMDGEVTSGESCC